MTKFTSFLTFCTDSSTHSPPNLFVKVPNISTIGFVLIYTTYPYVSVFALTLFDFTQKAKNYAIMKKSFRQSVVWTAVFLLFRVKNFKNTRKEYEIWMIIRS